MDTKKLGWGTRSVHAGRQKNSEGCLTVPIYQTSTFIFDSCAQGGKRFEGQEEGYIYTRLENPTQIELEKRIADLKRGMAKLERKFRAERRKNEKQTNRSN